MTWEKILGIDVGGAPARSRSDASPMAFDVVAAAGVCGAMEYEPSTAALRRLAEGGTGIDRLPARDRDHAAAGAAGPREHEASPRDRAGARHAY